MPTDEPTDIDTTASSDKGESIDDENVALLSANVDSDAGESDDSDVEEISEFELVEDPEINTPPPPLPAVPPARLPMVAAEELPATLELPDAISLLDKILDGRKDDDWTWRAGQWQSDLDAAKEPAQIAEIAYELGELQQRQLQDQSSAVQSYGKALKTDPSLRANLWAIRRVFYSRKLWPNLVKLIGAELRFASDDDQRADALFERGTILLHRLHDASEAKPDFEEVLRLREDDLSAVIALESIARQSGDQGSRWQLLKRMADLSGNPERRVSLLVELAREYRLSRDHWEEALELLDEAAQGNVYHELVCAEKELLAEAMDDAPALVSALDYRIERIREFSAPDADNDGQERRIAAIRRRQFKVLKRTGDKEAAWTYLQKGLIANPGDALLLADMTELADDLGRFDELAELVSEREAGETDAKRALALALERSAALEKAGRSEEAEELLIARAKSSPGFLPLIVARELHAAGRMDWHSLGQLQAELAEGILSGACFGEKREEGWVASDADRSAAAAHFLVAGNCSRYGDRSVTTEYYQRAAQVCPGHRGAAFALSAELVSRSLFSQAADALRACIVDSDTDADVAALDAIASVYFLGEMPKEELAILLRLGDLQPDRRDLPPRILELYRELKDSEKLAAFALVLAKAAQDAEVAAKYYFEAGYIYYMDLKRYADAAVAFRHCWQQWPSDPIVAELLLNALRREDNWEGVASYLDEILASDASDDLMLRAGRSSLAVLEFQLKEYERAYDRALALAQRHPDDLGALLDACACLAAGESRGEEKHRIVLIDLLNRLIDLCDGELQANLQLWAAIMLDRADQSSEAQRFAGEAASFGLLPGMLLGHRFAVKDRDNVGQREALEQIANSLPKAEDRASIFEHLGWLHLLDEEGQAAETFSKSIEEDPKRVGSRLGQMLETTMRQAPHDVQSESVAALAELCSAPSVKATLLLRSAMIAEVGGDLSACRGFLESARNVADIDANVAVAASDRISPLCADGSDHSEWNAIVRLCDERIKFCSSEQSLRDWSLQKAEALEKLGTLTSAKELVSAVLEGEPGDVRALRLLHKICQRSGDEAGVAVCGLALASTMRDSGNRKKLFRESAQIYDREDGDIAAAVACYSAILEEDAGASEYVRLVEILSEYEDVNSLYHVYSNRLGHWQSVGDGHLAVPIFLSRASLRESIGDVSGAMADVVAVLAIDSGNTDAMSAQRRLTGSGEEG